MQEGYQLDQTHGGRVPAEWVEGKPQRSFWVGVKLDGHDHREIQVFRCERCGYLESYAK